MLASNKLGPNSQLVTDLLLFTPVLDNVPIRCLARAQPVQLSVQLSVWVSHKKLDLLELAVIERANCNDRF